VPPIITRLVAEAVAAHAGHSSTSQVTVTLYAHLSVADRVPLLTRSWAEIQHGWSADGSEPDALVQLDDAEFEQRVRGLLASLIEGDGNDLLWKQFVRILDAAGVTTSVDELNRHLPYELELTREPSLEETGQISLSYLTVPYEASFDRLVTGQMLPWGAPSASAFEGNGSDGRIVLVNQEWPIEAWTVPDGDLDKPTMERLHIERFSTDMALLTGRRPYVDLRPGNVDPNKAPDFVATDPLGARVGVDLFRLTSAERIEAYRLLEALRSALLATPDRLAHLHGHVLYLWFAEGGGLPVKRAQVSAMVDAISAYRPDPSWSAVPNPRAAELPATTMPDTQGDASSWMFYATPFFGAGHPVSRFMAATGFELALSYRSIHPPDGMWRELERLVEKHDKPGIEHAVVTVGGPDRSGLLYPADHLLFFRALEEGLPDMTTDHITTVFVHDWFEGRVLIWQAGQWVWLGGPLYPAGLVPAHRAWAGR
jgi:hypothetical protein